MKLFEIYFRLNDTYRISKKKEIDQTNYLHVLYRKISLPLTAVALFLGLSANVMTLFSFTFLVISFVSFCNGLFLVGAFSYFFAYILDFVDGNIARYFSTSNYFGKFIDGLVDSLTFLLFLSVAIGNVYFGKVHEFSDKELPLGIINSFIFLFMAYFNVRIAYLRAELNNAYSSSASSPVQENKTSVLWVLIKFCKKSFNLLISALPIVLLLFVLLDSLFYFTIYGFLVFGVMGFGEGIIIIFYSYKKFNFPRNF